MTDRFMHEQPTLSTLVHSHSRPLPRTGTKPVYNFYVPAQADLVDTVEQLQFEIDALKFAPPGPSMSATRAPPVQPRPAAFTTTKVPKFSGSTSWDQYRQVFDGIVRSNGWDDATVALQLLSHMEGDTLNVALLVPDAQRPTRIVLVRALTDHYGSPGRLADYQRQFEKTARQDGKDPSIFTIDLETLGPAHRIPDHAPPARNAVRTATFATSPDGASSAPTPMSLPAQTSPLPLWASHRTPDHASLARMVTCAATSATSSDETWAGDSATRIDDSPTFRSLENILKQCNNQDITQ